MKTITFLFIHLLAIVTFVGSGYAQVPSLEEAKESKRDLWGELSIQQPDGPSYEFFEPLLPPPRYVHADFRFYPLVLSAPRSETKARLISNGSGVNLRGGSRSWNDVGVPFYFRVGPDEFLFGGLVERVSHPRPMRGWLPVYSVDYRHPSPVQAEGFIPIDQKSQVREEEVYRLEAFVSTDENLRDHAVVFIRFSLVAGQQGTLTIQSDPSINHTFDRSKWFDSKGDVVAVADGSWKLERGRLQAKLNKQNSACIAIATKPLSQKQLHLEQNTYTEHLAKTISTWESILSRSMQITVPEERINSAWRNLLVQNWQLVQKDRLFYSAANQYEQLYVTEGGDACLSMLNWGHEELAKEVFIPVLNSKRKGLEHHQAGVKLLDMARFWWMTRDRSWFMKHENLWRTEIDRLIQDRDSTTHLLPKGRYCGDISTQVHSLSVEGKAWRALHDWSSILEDLGDDVRAKEVREYAAILKTQVMDALQQSIRHETVPPFLPNALLDREEPHSPITQTRIGSYWNLMTGFFLESRLFPVGSEEEAWLPHYLESHGGLCMGMTRSGGTSHGFWSGSERTNPLYGTRYVIDTLRRNDPDRALVSFYGMLAHGFTRETLIAGEGCTMDPVDRFGRFFYCPPNSGGNAHFLNMLRWLLIQDWDMDGDGRPETLQLLSANSRRWLAEGESIEVRNAPTAFGPMSLVAHSHLDRAILEVDIDLPVRDRPRNIFLNPRLPHHWKFLSATVNEQQVMMDSDGSIDLSSIQAQKITVRYRCQPL
jgi:hypothetical protein